MKYGPRFIMFVAFATIISFSCSSQADTNEAEKKACGDSIILFMKAQRMMSDERGEIVQLSDRQEKKMKDLIRQGLERSRKVSDEFLDDFHPHMKNQYRNNLIKGWTRFLDGLESESPREQIAAIRMLQRWDSFRIRNVDLFVDRL